MSEDPTNPESCGQDEPGTTPSVEASWRCRPSLEDLYKYMDGAMEPDRTEVVTSHLGRCSGCDDFFHFHTGLRQLVGIRCRSELPKDLPQRVFRAIIELP
jgi:anti-sigma factor RsiW